MIHSTALIGENVFLPKGVDIGAYSIIGIDEPSNICLGDGVKIGHHCILFGDVEVGSNCTLDPFTRIGPRATIGSDTILLYGARVHANVVIGDKCVIAGNCPDNTCFGDEVIHLGKISHGFHFPFANWDDPSEIGPEIASRVVIGTDANIIGPISIGANTFIFPREIVRKTLPGNGFYYDGQFRHVTNWSRLLRILSRFGWADRA